MRVLLCLPLLLCLSGCLGTAVTVQQVKIEVPVPCVTQVPEKPSYPFQSAMEEEDEFSKVKKALAEIELRDAYETKLEVIVQGCSKL